MPELLLGRTLREQVIDPETGEMIADSGHGDRRGAGRAPGAARQGRSSACSPLSPTTIEYLSADEEEHYVMAQANSPLDELGQFADERVSARVYDKFLIEIGRARGLYGRVAQADRGRLGGADPLPGA